MVFTPAGLSERERRRVARLGPSWAEPVGGIGGVGRVGGTVD